MNRLAIMRTRTADERRVSVGQQREAAEELHEFIEPLASYICATDRPRAALAAALGVLLREVERTRRAALVHVNTLVEHHQP